MSRVGKIRWILLVPILAVLAGAFGFAGIDGRSHPAASELFCFFLVLFAVAAAGHVLRPKKGPDRGN